ncbi:hypothetical protein [Limnoraphis robusta]|uniref:Uncharacterized protein n=1 Tax=Limnoraphis robusta CCNP1315 TaxID=3110306 RepID=A0ABU5U0A4_9CYAN|nr:hypothetical protein [Limnoraphis robusta]MEA5520616.1 hypothetical protein [Limnoraphis robusta CCNP1315]MEA5548864.1 hypothetical protein [Limnoraphis robusta CCNP1324]
MSMEDMDSKVRSLREQVTYEVKKGSSSNSTRDALIAQIAAYLANADLTSSQKSTLQDLYAQLEALKNS